MLWIVTVLGCLPSSASELTPATDSSSYGKIEILRDVYGMSHVYSDTDQGAMYGLGYATAETRGFQMNFNLLSIQGRLSEILGDRPKQNQKESTISHDRKMRTFGFYRAAKVVAENLDADTKEMLQAYCHGVNDYLAKKDRPKHPMFEKFHFEPAHWTPADCIAVWWQLGQFFATDGTRELMQYRNRIHPPAARAGMMPPKPTAKWVDDSAAVVQREDVPDSYIDAVEQFLRANYPQLGSPFPLHPEGPKFSHAWVVGGKKAGGSAVLVSDPQTPVRYPSLWMEFHISGKTFNTRGIGVPGSPGILIGWNENVAWGATALGADQADLFRLKTDDTHVNQYLLEGNWEPMQIVEEKISVKDAPSIDLKVRVTKFGPIVTEFAFANKGDPDVSLRRVPMCITDRETIQGLFGFMRAKSVAELHKASASWQFPSVNLVFGDKQGNIGYCVAAAIPIRSPEDADFGLSALDGATKNSDWRGYVPAELLPRSTNPKRGWIASANHRPIASFYRIPIGISTGSMGDTIRSWRLAELLSEREEFKPSDVLAIHFDAVNPARREIVRLVEHIDLRMPNDQMSFGASSSLRILLAWRTQGAESQLDSAAGVMVGEINTFFRMMATPLALEYGGGESGLCRFLKDAGKRIDKDSGTQLSKQEVAFLNKALGDAWLSADAKFGADPREWSNQALIQLKNRRIEYMGTLDGFGSLDRSLDLRFPELFCIDGGTIKSQANQSYTQYVPIGNVDSAMSILPVSHSDLGDGSTQATMQNWSKGQLHLAPLSRSAVNKIAKSTVALKP